MTRPKFIAGNWKMNKTTAEAIALANLLKRELSDVSTVKIAICPPFTALDEVSEVVYSTNIQLGAQNMHWESSGAFTGEIAAPMLKELGCQYVILGHSERRQLFCETDEIINKKVKSALAADLIPVVCVGEILSERESNSALSVVERQITQSLSGVTSTDFAHVVIAYEPVWAIGTGKTATPQQAQEMHAFIRNLIKKMHSETISEQILILYGGSVKPDNTRDLMSQNDVDGALVGGASLDAKNFIAIVRNSLV